ncbi:MAG: hypothetical protein O7C59_04095, partial [Rickettsia endosymbiont of Ixodes persulcatus]|nr:hypothetical protein [Rickettsia endosymbiont of Ixodes persulcatus]
MRNYTKEAESKRLLPTYLAILNGDITAVRTHIKLLQATIANTYSNLKSAIKSRRLAARELPLYKQLLAIMQANVGVDSNSSTTSPTYNINHIPDILPRIANCELQLRNIAAAYDYACEWDAVIGIRLAKTPVNQFWRELNKTVVASCLSGYQAVVAIEDAFTRDPSDITATTRDAALLQVMYTEESDYVEALDRAQCIFYSRQMYEEAYMCCDLLEFIGANVTTTSTSTKLSHEGYGACKDRLAAATPIRYSEVKTGGYIEGKLLADPDAVPSRQDDVNIIIRSELCLVMPPYWVFRS